MINPEDDELDLRAYLHVLRNRKWIVVGIVVIVVSAAMAFTFRQTPIYRAEAEVLLRARSSDSLFNPQAGLAYGDPTRRIQTEIQVLRSPEVARRAADQLGFRAKASGRPLGQTDVVVVSATSPDPRRAAKVANAFAAAYVEFRRDQEVEDIAASVSGLQAKIDEIQAQIDSAAPRAAPTTTAKPAAGAAKTTSTTTIDSAERQSLISQQAAFKQQLDQLAVSQSIRTGGAQVVARAVVPTAPVSPTPVRNAVLALVVGLMFGVAGAFVIDHLDDTVKTREDVERVSRGWPVLALIPAVKGWRNEERTRVVADEDPKAPAAEAYRSLRTSINFMGIDRTLQTIQVTSSNPGEGKTSTVANLAVTLSAAGKRVVIVDCDLRRPRIHKFFGLSNSVGFTDVVLGEVPLSAALQHVPDHNRVLLLGSGTLTPRPSELLSSRRVTDVFDSLKKSADIILIDSPPVLPVTDPAVLSHSVDAVVVVVRARQTSSDDVQRTRQLLGQIDAPVMGIVLNGIGKSSEYDYQYAYEHPQKRRRWGKSAGGKLEPGRELDPEPASARPVI